MSEIQVTIKPEDARLAATTAQFNLILDQAAETAFLFDEFRRALTAAVVEVAGEDGTLSFTGGLALIAWVDQEWAALWDKWLHGGQDRDKIIGFEGRRRQAAQFAIDAHRLLHAYYFAPFKELTEQEGLFGGVVKVPDAPPFDRQLKAVLTSADRRLIGNPPITWSQRLWKHQNGGLNDMTNTINQAVANKTSAWELAKQLEDSLHVDARWTRWTRNRLYNMTPGSRILSKAGLIRKPKSIKPGMAPPTKGVAYNALRLARTELQAIHNLATDLFMQASPFVEKEHVHRSASAVFCAICDPIAGPPGGEGEAYEKGTVSLPNHPNCLCFKTAVLMARDLFVENVQGWVRSENSFLDGYRSFMQEDLILMAVLAKLARGQLMMFIQKE